MAHAVLYLFIRKSALSLEIESEYPTVKNCFIQNEKSLQFLLALGLDQPKAFEEIKYYILPRYKKKDDIAPSIILKDFNKMFSYFLNCPWHQKSDYLNQLKNIPLLPGLIYFPTDNLKNYFSHTPNIYFLDHAFYAEIENNYGKIPLYNFFKELGIEDKPKRIKIKATLSVQQREAIHQGIFHQNEFRTLPNIMAISTQTD